MHAIRAAHAFDGNRFLPGGATVVVDGDRIVGVETGRDGLPADVEVAAYAGTVLPGLIDCHTHLVADCTATRTSTPSQEPRTRRRTGERQ
jgi:imidazolonepropionase-like amidohydrolase